MGYRSEVRAVIYGPEDKINALIADHQLRHGNTLFECFGEALTRYRIVVQDYIPSDFDEGGKPSRYVPVDKELDCLDLYGDSWKWYENYENVKAWERLMSEAEETFGLQYEFVRIGEELDDIERKCSADDHILISAISRIVDDIAKVTDSNRTVRAL